MTKCKECKERDWDDIVVLHDGSSTQGELWQCRKCKRVVLMDEEEYPNQEPYEGKEGEE